MTDHWFIPHIARLLAPHRRWCRYETVAISAVGASLGLPLCLNLLSPFLQSDFLSLSFRQEFRLQEDVNVSKRHGILRHVSSSEEDRLTFAVAASASFFLRIKSSTLSGVTAGFFAPHPSFCFFWVSAGGGGGTSSGGGGGAMLSGGGGGAVKSSGGGGGGLGRRSTEGGRGGNPSAPLVMT